MLCVFVLLCIFLLQEGSIASMSFSNFKASDGKCVEIYCTRTKTFHSKSQTTLAQGVHRELGNPTVLALTKIFIRQECSQGSWLTQTPGQERCWLICAVHTGNPPAAFFTLVVPHRNTYSVLPCQICAKSCSSWQQISCFLAKCA